MLLLFSSIYQHHNKFVLCLYVCTYTVLSIVEVNISIFNITQYKAYMQWLPPGTASAMKPHISVLNCPVADPRGRGFGDLNPPPPLRKKTSPYLVVSL